MNVDKWCTDLSYKLQHIRLLPLWLSLLAEFAVIYDFGFDKPGQHQVFLFWFYFITIIVGAVSLLLRYFSRHNRPRKSVWLFDVLLFLFLLALLIDILEWTDLKLSNVPHWLYLGLFLIFVREFSTFTINYKKRYLNPAQLFVLSFLLIVFAGSVLLTLPHATYSGITLVDALFTATSAVCVTGLIVVDTATYFTPFGQFILLLLIQLGGIGIMTFTSYFSYFFKGESSYENQLMLSDMTNSKKISEVYETFKRIILLTIAIEAIGAVFIFFSVDRSLFDTATQRIFFSAFHSVSGFCNAGFSTLSNGLFQSGFRFNYSLHLILAFLLIIGGLGFPIVFNFFSYLKYVILKKILPITSGKASVSLPWIIHLNTRIVIITTLALIVGGTTLVFVFEYDNTLAPHSLSGKIVTAFFSAVTPRTAGFNTVDFGAMRITTLMLVLFLMFVGASPSSTGGGIKTSTLALAILNSLSLARGKSRIEVYNKEISVVSIQRAFAIIALSILTIGIATVLLVSLEKDLGIMPVVFETVSAYSTVGLSMGITGQLSNAGKMVLVVTMFIGRVSMLTILASMLRSIKHQNYTYPVEGILIN